MGASSLKPAGTPAPVPVPVTPGQRIGEKYVVLHLMAQGGMAWVAAARHIDLDEIVAIKFLKTDFAVQPEIVARFAREAKTAMQIRSDHCVRIMDVGFDSVLGPFIVMEHLEGADLAGVISTEGPITPRRAADLILQVCDALAAAHVLGIIHRDVKPENVFVSQHGDMEVVRVLDFGISKATVTGKIFNTDLSVLKTQSLLGSPVYMSPEQMRGKDVDMRSDIWSVGATLYEAVVGQVAFNAASVTEICSMVLENEPPPPPSHVPEGLRRVILKCLEKDPSRRYQNVAELALALVPFAPSGARLWVERIVSIMKSHGIKIDASSLKSTPPPPESSDPASERANRAIATTPTLSDVTQNPAERAFGVAIMTTPPDLPLEATVTGVSTPHRSVALLGLAAFVLACLLGGVAYLGLRSKPPTQSSVAAIPPSTAIAPAAGTGTAAGADTTPSTPAAPATPPAAPATPPTPPAIAATPTSVAAPQVALGIATTSPLGRTPRPHAPKTVAAPVHEPPPPPPAPPPVVAAPAPHPADPVDVAPPAPAASKSGRARIIDDTPRPKLVD